MEANIDKKKTLRYSIATLTLGIISISGCWIDCYTPILFFLYPPFGIVCGILGRKIGLQAKAMYELAPEVYESCNMIKTGRILSKTGFIIGIVSLAAGVVIAIAMWAGAGILSLQEFMPDFY